MSGGEIFSSIHLVLYLVPSRPCTSFRGDYGVVWWSNDVE